MPKREAEEGITADSSGKKPKQDDAEVDIAALESAYRTALALFKKEKLNKNLNKDLRRAKSAAKKAWDEAVAASNPDSMPEAEESVPAASLGNEPKQDDAEVDIAALESAYRTALAAFKKEKTNKDLRRARSAAKKAWDSAIAASNPDGEQLLCRDCSQMFIFGDGEKEFYSDQGWQHKPTRCQGCNESYKGRRLDRTKRDSKDKNMCFAFQRGECTHGDHCRFSHYQKDSALADSTRSYKKGECFAFQKGECERGDDCVYNHTKPKVEAQAPSVSDQ